MLPSTSAIGLFGWRIRHSGNHSALRNASLRTLSLGPQRPLRGQIGRSESADIGPRICSQRLDLVRIHGRRAWEQDKFGMLLPPRKNWARLEVAGVPPHFRTWDNALPVMLGNAFTLRWENWFWAKHIVRILTGSIQPAHKSIIPQTYFRLSLHNVTLYRHHCYVFIYL